MIGRLWAIAAFLVVTSAGSAFAASVPITGSYTVTYTTSSGPLPTLTNQLGGTSSGGTSQTFSTSDVAGATTAFTNLFSANPGSSSCSPSHPSYCNSSNDLAQGTIKLTITINNTTTGTTTLTEMASYVADYNGNAGSCVDSKSSGQTDCVDWTGTNGQYGSILTTSNVDLSNGDVLNIELENTADWTMYPQIAFELTSGSNNNGSTPLPPALTLFAGGLGMMGLFGRRRKKATDAVASCAVA